MSSDLSILAARLREFIAISSSEALYLEPSTDPGLISHLDAEFNGMALVLFARQFANNPVYGRLCESRGVHPDAVHHWKQIPAVSTIVFKETELTSIPSSERTAVFHSSGTTGQRPSRHFHSAESLELYEASLWPWFERHVIHRGEGREGVLMMALTPPPASAPQSSLVHMFDTVRRKLDARDEIFFGAVDPEGAWCLNTERILGALAGIAGGQRPVALVGTAFSFVHLMDAMKERAMRLQLPADSVLMETGGYKGRSRAMPRHELHALLSDALGIRGTSIICEYGMSELSSQAYDRGAADRVFRFPPWARAQVVSVETGREVAEGETGWLRLFDLANVFSVMAVQTEDLAIRRADGFELVGRAAASEPRGCSLMPTGITL